MYQYLENNAETGRSEFGVIYSLGVRISLSSISHTKNLPKKKKVQYVYSISIELLPDSENTSGFFNLNRLDDR